MKILLIYNKKTAHKISVKKLVTVEKLLKGENINFNGKNDQEITESEENLLPV